MFKKFIKNYYKLFDEKLGSGTAIVLIIACLISAVWDITNPNNLNDDYLVKASINEFKTDNKFIELNWKTYQLID